MKLEFPFPHHTYHNALDAGEFEFIPADQAMGVEDWNAAELKTTAELLRHANVTGIILIHGTFAGDDILGLMRELGRVLPGAADSLRSLGKRLVDQVAGELGNYTATFAEQLYDALNADDGQKINVTRFSWSGENHHLGRASGALLLLQRLLESTWEPDQRLLLCGHSHGGNLLALMSNLIACSKNAVDEFFGATQSHYRDPLRGRLDLPHWEQMRQELKKENIRARLPKFDVVTFGTPPRYRFNRSVCEKLLHFVQHRSLDEASPIRACLPTSIQELSTAAGGDYVQQLGLAGTDFLHSILAWRSWSAERRLRRMLEPEARRRDLPQNLQKGHRVSLDGTTLLTDYPGQPNQWNQALLGHGIYTRSEWIPFHLQQIAQRFYR